LAPKNEDRYPRLVIFLGYDITARQRIYAPLFGVYTVDDFHRVREQFPDDFPDDFGGYAVVTLH
jgi:hypothetical protein